MENTVADAQDTLGITPEQRHAAAGQFAHASEIIRAGGDMEYPIQLLLTDVVMPGITGRELAHRLRVLRPELRVLCMSGYNDAVGDPDPEIAYLQKPFTAEALMIAVREVLDDAHGTPGAAG